MLFALYLLQLLRAVPCDRGTITRDHDEAFNMLIAGGVLPDNGKYASHVVSIRTLEMIEYPGDNHFCTGVIISSTTILTAAHCVTDKYKSVMNPRALLIVFGSVYRLENYGREDSRRVQHIKVHYAYVRYKKFDAALLHLRKRIPPNMRHAQPVLKRDTVRKPIMQTTCVTIGWGQVYPHGPYSNELMFLDISIRPHEYCKRVPHYDEDSNLCGEPHAEGQVCPGDLGGPLLCHDVLSGIIGGSQKCEGKHALKFVNYTTIEHWVEDTLIEFSRGSNKCLTFILTVFTILRTLIQTVKRKTVL
ncbi:CG15873 [Drosophila busckii]|uniref:CG15873 n=2 Tax=Drosophila busckii TaxID=30019 RepID=A0A0M4EE44_DROBS|nr:CG15873 [Drosophila busckii]